MSKLNLAANNKQEELVLAYLQQNASETLVEKINNGVYIEKDGKRLLNKKDLKGFMRFACEEARKLAEKGANSACVEDSVVYGWVVHYFEEAALEGTLYNADGTEYKKVVAKPTSKSTVTTKPVITQKKPSRGQLSIFDMNFDETMTDEPTKEISETENTNPFEEDYETEEIDEATIPPTAEQEEKFFDEFDSNVRKLSEVEEKENNETPLSSTGQATAVDTPTPKAAEQHSQPQQTKSPAELLYYKYEIMQKQYPEHILFYRLGDFYEAFGKSAELASDCLDLTLTGKNCGSLGRIPMCGVPYHVVEVYVEKLRKYYGVVLMHSDTELKEYPKINSANTVKEIPKTVPNHKATVVANKEINTETNNSPDIEYFNNVDNYTNKETGEITLPKIDENLFNILYELLDGQIIMG